MLKKIIALVLAILMVMAVFVGCGKKKNNLDSETKATTKAHTTLNDDDDEEDVTPDDEEEESEETEEETERQTIDWNQTNADITLDGEVNDTAEADEWSVDYILNPDNWEGADEKLESIDYEGYDFNVLADTANSISQYEFLVESDGSIIKEKVAERKAYVEEYLGINFNIVEFEGGYGNMEGFASEIEASSGAGTPYDLSVSYCLIPPIVAAKGLSRDLAESDNLNLLNTTKPYWGSGIKDEIMIGGRIFWMSDNSSWTSIRSMTGIFVNVDMFERVNQGLTKQHLYDMVHGKTWTMENLLILSQNGYANTNTGEEKIDGIDNGDEFGFAAAVNMARVDLWLYGAGYRYTKLNNRGTYEWTLADQPLIDFINWWQEMIQNDDDVRCSNPGSDTIVTDGRAIFMHAPVLTCEDNIEYNFTVLPMPFYKTAVKNNYTTSLCNMYGSYLIPKATKTEAFERSATVLEILAAGGNKYLAPAYFEIYLKRQVAAADLEMMKMFNIIRNSIAFDLGYLYGTSLTVENLNGSGYDELFLALRRLWTDSTGKYNNITTIWAQVGGTATTKLNNLMVDILDY